MRDGETAAQGKRRFKDQVYAAVARVPGALANRHRLELLDLLAQRPRTVQEVSAEAGLSVANASQHLQVLARCGLVSVERRGTYAYYHAVDESVYRLLVALRTVAEAADAGIGEAERSYFGTREPGIATFLAAKAVIAERRTALLDARPRAEYEAGHLPGALSAPVQALRAGTIRLQRSKRYVVYCRGPYCVFADEAVTLLRERGYDATRLALGPAEWLAAGGTVERVG
ncbi:MAG TPA: metalloregulator ArsR/SmtB family transcription factor [Candidatus Limnocylindria bacterium]|jgi:rhodanese-related sulfurtransferase/DNA-binding transcriptional ArsR family regulator|nr:metalloregulator ArsR/SmtB family transcription factor [Candidatus Limnocylindria bacterium]